jgi:hypothetical protein
MKPYLSERDWKITVFVWTLQVRIAEAGSPVFLCWAMLSDSNICNSVPGNRQHSYGDDRGNCPRVDRMGDLERNPASRGCDLLLRCSLSNR